MATVAQRLFTFQFLMILSSIQTVPAQRHQRLDRDDGIAYLAENTCGGSLGKGILRSSPPLPLDRLMVEHEQPAPSQNQIYRHHRLP